VGWSLRFARSSIPYRKDSRLARRRKIKFDTIDELRNDIRG